MRESSPYSIKVTRDGCGSFEFTAPTMEEVMKMLREWEAGAAQ